ncbi:MAG: hypothetical protein HOK20_02535, partial [Alphaproteobacteria bacterium]|nr:hypothetical protein [Alphaproteobacteria bacterium]
MGNAKGNKIEPAKNVKTEFELEDLSLSQDFGSMVGVKKVVTTVPVRKPHKQEFVRVRPEDDFHFSTAVIEIKEDKEIFLVEKKLWNELTSELIPKVFLTGITRQGVLFLWPIRLPGPDGKHDNWNRSALEAAELAKKKWVKVVSNMSLGGYEVFEATGELPEPEWPDLSFEEIIKIAFKDRYIKEMDHP